jgi:hypothetical protein
MRAPRTRVWSRGPETNDNDEARTNEEGEPAYRPMPACLPTYHMRKGRRNNPKNLRGKVACTSGSVSSAFAAPLGLLPSRASSPCNRCGGVAFADVGARIPSSGARPVDNLSIMRRLFVGLGVIHHAGRSRGRILLQNQLFGHLQCLLECCKWGVHVHLPSL